MSVPLKFLRTRVRVTVRPGLESMSEEPAVAAPAGLFRIHGDGQSFEALIHRLPLTWYQAVVHVDGCGGGWRLPTIGELDLWCDREESWGAIKMAVEVAMRGGPGERLIRDFGAGRPEGERQLHVWSSDVMHGYQDFVWSLGTGDRQVYGHGKTGVAAVMCVREVNRRRGGRTPM